MRPQREPGRRTAGVPETLAELLGVDPAELEVRIDDAIGADLVIALGTTFVIVVNKSTSAAPIAAAAKKAREVNTRLRRLSVPLVAVPFMGEVGRKACAEASVGWFDLSGNARIIAPGIRVIIDGRPNRFRLAGQPFTRGRLTTLVRKHVQAAGLGKSGACHLFRHTMATLMLEGGADIRYIQQMLGHENLSTTQIYTQVSIRRLKEIHTTTHPGAQLKRPSAPDNQASEEPRIDDEGPMVPPNKD